jgi:putative transposase
MSVERRRQMIEPAHPKLSVVRQCELVSISRSGFYYQPSGETPLNLTLMRLIDVQFLETPWDGSRQMARHLRREGYTVGRKRVRRLMAKMGLEPISQRPRTTVPHPEHQVYPYLLREVVIDRPNQVCRHNVYTNAAWLPLPGCGDGLVPAQGAVVAGIEHAGRGILH